MEPESDARAVKPASAGDADDVPAPSITSTTAPDVRACYYACRSCRTPLFNAAEVLQHDPQEGAKKTFKFRRGGPLQSDGAHGDAPSGPLSSAEICTSLFLDPDQTPWVAEDIREANSSGAAVQPDTIYCRNPRCRAKLGMQSWTGSQCSCGTWVTPAFRIHTRSVDKMLHSTPTFPTHATTAPE
ncbi:hypothetical protein, conserved [Leishmania tarentolae]|uniref:protein-tyrosine-phosphatase n=1 Tax=Leishmania tarentolae TaxID=5689 RepID=A0A640KBH5_LEITA|nr:hypothetical protein, conserved [Leishmania tarentolae]